MQHARVRALLTLTLCAFCAFFSAEALARPGGGHTFGGGSSSSGGGGGSGGGSSGDGELVFLLLRLIFAYPKIGIPVVIVLVVLWMRAKNAAPAAWTSSHAEAATRTRPAAQGSAAIRTVDPDFSQVILEDFAFRLYASAQRARHDERALAALAPYLSSAIRSALAQAQPVGVPVTNVVVGALQLLAVSDVPAAGDSPASTEITLGYEANLSYGTGAAARTEYVRERWVLSRDQRARTKPPEETERLGCPNCGAPFESSDGRRCAYCSEVVADGRFAFQVVRRSVLGQETRPPALTGDVADSGTDAPTLFADDNAALWDELKTADPALDGSALEARLRVIYEGLNAAWSACEIAPMRALVSDGMFDYLRYWVEAYQQQGLRNTLTGMAISRLERVKVVRDKHFDAITFRLWASGFDATVRADTGQVVGGSPTRKRAYTEYWTVVRSAAARGPARTDATCPSCAAKLEVTMAGTCSHCGSHLTRGEFDWVLSKIEQDEVYAG